jgi:hypothetical protein
MKSLSDVVCSDEQSFRATVRQGLQYVGGEKANCEGSGERVQRRCAKLAIYCVSGRWTRSVIGSRSERLAQRYVRGPWRHPRSMRRAFRIGTYLDFDAADGLRCVLFA